MKKLDMKLLRIISGILIVCMVIVDAGMFWYANNMTTYTYSVEKHQAEVAYADGDFGGTGSDNEHKEEDYIEVNKEKHAYNILEIVPSVGMGVMGYAVSGCEPVIDGITNDIDPVYGVTDEVLRDAYMDALLNKNPGEDGCNYEHSIPQDLKNINEKMREGAGQYPFTLETNQKYDGYYKYVGSNKGVYAVVWKNEASKSAKMVSKFYNTNSAYNGKFDYIWVGSGASSTEPNDINVVNHPKMKYKNNDKFLLDSYGVAASKLDEWKSNNQVKVVSRTPKGENAVTYKDIETADLIIINSGNNLEYYPCSQTLYNLTHGTSYTAGNFSKENDFPSFEYAVRIYERVAIREDVTIISSRNVINGTNFDTNIRKLMCMLYYVNNPKDSSRTGSGRLMFMDYMKRYGYEAGSHNTIDPETGNEISIYEMQQREGGDKYKAPGLSGGYSEGGVFMHKTHPLVKYKSDAVTGYTRDENNDIVLIKGGDANNRRTAKKNNKDMYSNDGASVGTLRIVDNYEIRIDDNLDNTAQELKNRYRSQGYFDLEIGSRIDIYENGNEKNNQAIADEIWDLYSEKENEYYYLRSSKINSQKRPSNSSDRENYENGGLKGNYDDYRWRMPLYESKSNTTDYLYIDDNGNFYRDTKYSGLWYGNDPLSGSKGGDNWEYKIVKWDAIDGVEKWPWNVVDGGCLKEWWFGNGAAQVPGDCSDKHIHIFYDYYGYGKYTAVTDSIPGTYKNQSLEQESDLFKGDLIKNAVAGREVKREEKDNHMVETDEKVKVYYYLGVNIVNGDGFNKETTNANKVLYVNDYELSSTTSIPLNFEIRSSDTINRIELIKIDKYGGETIINTYSGSSSNDLTTSDTSKKLVFSGGLELARLRGTIDGVEYDDATGNPKAYTGPVASQRYIYTFKGKVDIAQSYYNKGSNNKFAIRVWTKPAKSKPEISSTDYMTIAVRDFFELN